MATRIDAQTFEYKGELEGGAVNEPGVMFGAVPAPSFQLKSAGEIAAISPPTTAGAAVSPAHATGTVDVRAAANGVASAKNAPADQFGYL